MQVNVVSLCHRVLAQVLTPIRTSGLGFVLDTYLPFNVTIVLPLEKYAAPSMVLFNSGSGYEYRQNDGVRIPKASTVTERLRPHPEELSVP